MQRDIVGDKEMCQRGDATIRVETDLPSWDAEDLPRDTKDLPWDAKDLPKDAKVGIEDMSSRQVKSRGEGWQGVPTWFNIAAGFSPEQISTFW